MGPWRLRSILERQQPLGHLTFRRRTQTLGACGYLVALTVPLLMTRERPVEALVQEAEDQQVHATEHHQFALDLFLI